MTAIPDPIRLPASALLLALAPAVLANDFGSQQAYRFSDANERIAKISAATLIEQKKGGAFHYTYNTHIERQINCTLSVGATGNTAQPSNSGSGIAPAGILNSGIDATTTGNQATTSSSPLNSGSASEGGLLGGLPGTVTSGGSTQLSQGNDHSSLGSSVSGSGLNSRLGPINAQGADIDNTISTSQSNDGAQINAQATHSSACAMAGLDGSTKP